MRTEKCGDPLHITEIPPLPSDNCGPFKEYVHGAVRPEHKIVHVDLGRARTVDSAGIGAPISARKAVCLQGGRVRWLRPGPLTGGQIFEIIPR